MSSNSREDSKARQTEIYRVLQNMRFKRCNMKFNCLIGESKMEKFKRNLQRNALNNSSTSGRTNEYKISASPINKFDGAIKMCRIATFALLSLSMTAALAVQIGDENGSRLNWANTNNTYTYNNSNSNSSKTNHLSKLFVTGRTVLDPLPAPASQVNITRSQQKVPVRAQVNETSAKTILSNKNTGAEFGEQTSDSLFRPAFLKGLLGGGSQQEKPSGGGQDEEEEEEEEVTQTIEVPMTQSVSASDNGKSGGLAASGSKNSAKAAKAAKLHQANLLQGLLRRQRHQDQQQTNQNQRNQQQHQMQQQLMQQLDGQHPGFNPMDIQPRPEASFRLSNSEMNSILNDREAPEFYKERETSGDGVLVGEEQQPRLGTAASDRMNGPGPNMMGGYMNPYMGGAGGSMPNSYSGDSFVDQRLHQAGSGDSSLGGFNHRFGQQQQQGYGGQGGGGGGGSDIEDEDEINAGNQRGRLMQSPNEFNEMNSNGGYGNPQGPGNYGPMDYSPQSGYLRAGSGDYGEQPEGNFGGGGGGGGMGVGGSGGYPNSPVLDRHASEMYGPGSSGFGHSGGGGGGGFGRENGGGGYGPDFGMQAAGYGGRLNQAGSHMGDSSFGPNGGGFGPGDDYSSRFGQSGGYSQQGFANQNNMMLRGNSMRSDSMDDSSMGRLRQTASRNGPKIVPLTPVVPVAEDLIQNAGFPGPSPMNLGDRDSMRSGSRPRQHKSKQQPEVHEALDDDIGPGDTGESDESGSHYDGSANDDSDDGPSTDESVATTMATDGGSNPQQQQPQQSSGRLTAHSLRPGKADSVLPGRRSAQNGDNDAAAFGQPMSGSYRQQVEFNRIGSAGYLGPNTPEQTGERNNGHKMPQKQRLLKKTSGFLVHRDIQQQPQPQPQQHQQHHHNQQQSHRSSARDGSDYDPAENPAHAGKYIID